jgi:hypothetical protein
MDEITVIRRLNELAAPGSVASKTRALEAVPAQVGAARSTTRSERRFWSRFAVAAALGLMLVISFSVLTSPGQAFTNWVGDRIGFGEPGGPPALHSLHTNSMRGTIGEGVPAYVLLRGPGPLGGAYEFITFEATSPTGRQPTGGSTRCFQLEFPDAQNLFHAGCGVPSPRDPLLYEGVGGNSATGASYQFASGRVSDEVATVDLAIDGQSLPVELRAIPADLIERFDIGRPFKFFVVFLDGNLRKGDVTVTARDAAGEVLATRTESLLGAPALQP